MRVCELLVIAVAGLTFLPGCRMFERLTKEKEKPPSADPASRLKDKDWLRERNAREPDDDGKRPKNWYDAPAPRAADAASRGSGQRMIAGTLEDPDGRPVPNAEIVIENADPTKAGFGAPITVRTDPRGYFMIPGLPADDRYTLSSQLSIGGRTAAARQNVLVPNERVRLQLREDFRLPPRAGANDLPADRSPQPPLGSVPPLFDVPGRSDLPAPRENNPNDTGWNPLGPGRPADPFSRPAATRPDLTTNIPGPTNVPPPTMSPGPTSRSLGKTAEFAIVSTDGRVRTFPSGRADEFVLLDFMTTTCVPCKKAVPALKDLQDQYGARTFEIIAVACDAGSDARRRELADRYRTDQHLNYPIYADSTPSAQDLFNVESYPTLILIDGTGRRHWRGHPKKLDELQAVLRDSLGRR